MTQSSTTPVDAIEHWRTFAPELAGERILFSELVPGGAHWSFRLPRGSTLSMIALEDGANLSLVLYSALEKLERYNMPDSLKAQHTAHYSRGHVLMSDMGRSMASITADTLVGRSANMRAADCSMTAACARNMASATIRARVMACIAQAVRDC